MFKWIVYINNLQAFPGCERLTRTHFVIAIRPNFLYSPVDEQKVASVETDTRQTWPTHLYEDYSGAAIRLTTVSTKHEQYLVYACVELYPHEIPLPPKNGIRLLKKRINKCGTLASTITVKSVSDALAWYEAALHGHLKAPGIDADVDIKVCPLAPEPALGRLLVAKQTLPFDTRWYCGPRIHHLVPMQAPPDSLDWLTPDSKTPARTKARQWLIETLGFDMLAYDEYLFSLVLLVPNPVARSVGWQIEETLPGGGERIKISVVPRQGASISDLQVFFREERAEGTSLLGEYKLDRNGCCTIDFPQPCSGSRLELVSPTRGVLGSWKQPWFPRNVHVESRVLSHKADIFVPGRRKTDAQSSSSIAHWEGGHQGTPPIQTPSAERRVLELRERRALRTGAALPEAMAFGEYGDERLFYQDRERAVRTIRSLVAQAKHTVVFVDPYFDHIDIRELAMGTQFPNVDVHILIHREPLKKRVDPDNPDSILCGDRLAEDIKELDETLSLKGVVIPRIRIVDENSRAYHDRFLVIDDQVWHFGHSFNMVGKHEVSMAIRLKHPDEIYHWIMDDVVKAMPFTDAWPIIKGHME